MLHNINLLDWRQQQRISSIRRWCGCLWLGGGIFLCSQIIQWGRLVQQETMLEDKQWALIQNKQKLEATINLLGSKQKHLEYIQAEVLRVRHWKKRTEIPYMLMSLIAESVPDSIYLQFVELSEQQVMVSGYGNDASGISLFHQRLSRHPCHCVEKLNTESVSHVVNAQGQNVHSFRLSFFVSPDSPDKKG